MRKIRFFALLLALCLCLGGVFARAEEWSEEYYRAYDATGEVTDAQTEELDDECLTFVKTHQLDLAMLAVSTDQYEGKTLEELAQWYYEDSHFGYGENKDGFVMAYDTQTEDIVLLPFGSAGSVVPEEYLAFVARSAAEMREDHGVWGVMYATYRHLELFMEDPDSFRRDAQSGELPEIDMTEPEQTAEAAMPAWYPADPKGFAFYHDEDAPRVVDDADIFTDAEESAMEARITELRRELQRDIVVFTDLSTHGLGRDVYAADFYDFNGYGYGAEREGFCLFICMDPNNRGFWTVGTGSDTRSLHTEDIANKLDDALYDFMVAGQYGEGAADWIENIAGLYRKGILFAPEWYPDRGTELVRFHDESAPRVWDEAGLMSEAETAALAERAAGIARKYGVDVVIHTMEERVSSSGGFLADAYYLYGGYGLGDDYDGIELTVFKTGGYLDCVVTDYGAVKEKMSHVNRARLTDRCDAALGSEGCYEAASRWLDQTEHLLKTGRVPHPASYWSGIAAFAALAGSIFGGAALGVAKHKMRAPQIRYDAREYLTPNGLRVARLNDQYTGTTTSRRYSPRERDDDSRGGHSSGGHSSYSSSYSGSSGASHSGSGRSF